MIKADKYIKEAIQEVIDNGSLDQNPRPKWKDGSPAHSKFITQQVFKYSIWNGEYPITTLRTTALKGAFYDIEAIYIKQTNILEEMHPSIHPWWEDFVVDKSYEYKTPSNQDIKESITGCDHSYLNIAISMGKTPELSHSYLGMTYGRIIKEQDQMNKLLKGLEKNPFGRRHITNMFDFTCQSLDPDALVPCAYNTMWSVRAVHAPEVYKIGDHSYEYDPMLDHPNQRVIDLTLTQRSMDYLMVMSINPAQYVMLGMMVCNHLTFKTGIVHQLGNFVHFVQNLHVYDHPSHWEAAEELLKRPSLGQPTMKLKCGPKDFYEHTVDDFEIVLPEGIKKLDSKLELAI